ncbi:MAG: hypothetical protein ACRDYD_01100 [Acidimicrobiales bacterium]
MSTVQAEREADELRPLPEGGGTWEGSGAAELDDLVLAIKDVAVRLERIEDRLTGAGASTEIPGVQVPLGVTVDQFRQLGSMLLGRMDGFAAELRQAMSAHTSPRPELAGIPGEALPELTVATQAAVIAVGESLEREVQARLSLVSRELTQGQARFIQQSDALVGELRELVARRQSQDEERAELLDYLIDRLILIVQGVERPGEATT